ncbi:uncharacterized protein LOC143371912 [Andrena cerasifolii]|uniref:uncharacterized protein LOC143371912 n=1 Tax=Andrena cerasifolii TaxID=2819439 RepID=UPI004037E229
MSVVFDRMSDQNSSDAPHLERVVYKRRSSIFRGRTIVFDEDKGTQLTRSDKCTDTDAGAERASEASQEEAFNLEEYINGLRNEREEWIGTFRRRKAEQKSLTKHKLRLESEGQPLDVNILSDSERTFVIARPDYQNICKSNKRLSERTLRVSVLNQMTNALNQRFILQMEKRLGKVTKKVIQTSDS